jgi:hypothetical protein
VASSAGGDDKADILSKDKERRRGDVDCCAEWSEVRDKVGRLWDEGRDDFVGVSWMAKSATSVEGGGCGVRYCCLGRWGTSF